MTIKIDRIIKLLILTLIPVCLIGQHQRRMVAEWEPAHGTLIRWPLGIPQQLVTELASDDSLYVLVESFYERDQAINTFTSWGVNLAHCRFIFAPTYSHWTRDWGPHYIFDGKGHGGIADPVFNGYPWVPGCNQEGSLQQNKTKTPKGWEEDDAVNGILADSFSCPLINLPVFLTGGNIMTDGHGTAVSTAQMLDENYPGCDEECFRGAAKDSLGITRYLIVENPEIYGIQHIDCYAKFLDEETVLVKELPTWHPEYACVEDLADRFKEDTSCFGRPYTVVRIFCGSYNGEKVAAYTNSLILNKKVLVPLFGINTDQQALDTYAAAMPGYEVLGFPYSGWYYYDALHCRTMGIFDRQMLRISHKPLKGDVQMVQGMKIIAMIDDRSEAGLISGELLLHWREQGNSQWNLSVFTPAAGVDTFEASLPLQVPDKVIEYYISAADSSGRNETLPRIAPDGFYSFTLVDTVSGIAGHIGPGTSLEIYPTVFSHRVNVAFSTSRSEMVRISILDITGRTIALLYEGICSEKENLIIWDGKSGHGMDCKPGLYFIVMANGSDCVTRRCLKSD